MKHLDVRKAGPPLLLLAAALTLRLFRLSNQSLWLDEGGTWDQVTSRSWWSLATDLWSGRAGYPLYHLLIKGWVAVAGDSEWALRFPSALAGALAVPLLYALGRRLAGERAGMLAALLLLANPFALWMSQDAKVYAILMALVIWSLLLLLDALERDGWSWWRGPAGRWLASLVLLMLVHRLALLAIIGEVAIAGWYGPLGRGRLRRLVQFAPLALLAGLAFGLASGLRRDPNAPPPGATISPLRAAWLLAGRFGLDRSSDDIAWLLIPILLALALGVAALIAERERLRMARWVLGLAGLGPLALFLVVLAVGAPLYEPRYIGFALPLALLAAAIGLDWLGRARVAVAGVSRLALPVGGALLLVAAQIYALVSAPGLWSGIAVKEDYRAAVAALARRVVPGDAVILHPAYIAPLYRYYAGRVTPDPLPEPRAFGRAGAVGYNQGEFDNDYVALLSNHPRGWLLIAPENARAIDPPDPRYPQDDMGRVGINFLTADKNDKWRCVEGPYLGFNGLRVLCQSFPAPLPPDSLDLRGDWPIPQSATATFGDSLELLGYAFAPWDRPAGAAVAAGDPPVARAGGTLPLRTVWRARTPLPRDYRLFVHLVPALGAPVAAQLDSGPLGGGLPTTAWPAGRPIHDELAVPLPADMPAGRYLVVLGWYDPTIAGVEAQRLPVTAHSSPAQPTLVELGAIDVIR